MCHDDTVISNYSSQKIVVFKTFRDYEVDFEKILIKTLECLKTEQRHSVSGLIIQISKCQIKHYYCT